MAKPNSREDHFGPLLKKTVRNILIHKLRFEYGFGYNKKLAAILVDDILDEVAKHTVPISAIKPGQMLWLAVAEDEAPGHYKTMDQHKLVPVILTLVNDEDLEKLRTGAKLKEVRKGKIARLFKEAKAQKGVLTQLDIASILGIAGTQVGEAVKVYQQETGMMLPSRGWVHDLGPTVTHKAIIVKLHLQGYLTEAISRMTYHSPKSVDSYIKGFEKVRLLKGKFDTEQIVAITGMAPGLVRQYENLIKEYLEEKLPDIKEKEII